MLLSSILLLDHLINLYSRPEWTHVLTDKFSEATTRKGGIEFQKLMQNVTRIEKSAGSRETSTSYRAQLQDILEATKTLQEQRHKNTNMVCLTM